MGRPRTAPLPTGIETVITDRINRLSADAHEVLKIASVEGEEFSRANLMALLRDSISQRELDRCIQELLDRGLITTRVGFDRLGFAHSLYCGCRGL